MSNKSASSDPLQDYLSDKIGEKKLVDIITQEIRDGSFIKAIQWVYVLSASHFEYNSIYGKCNKEEDFSRQTGPTQNAIRMAAQIIDPCNNTPALQWAKLVLINIFEERWSGNMILQMARDHFAHVHGLEKYSPPKMPPLETRIPKRVGAPLVRQICASVKPGKYAEALRLMMPLVDHIYSRLEKGKHVLERQGSRKDGTPMIEIRYLHESLEFRPWSELNKSDINAANATLIGLQSSGVVPNFTFERLAAMPPAALNRLNLAVNMFACLINDDDSWRREFVCEDLLKAAASYVGCYKKLPDTSAYHRPAHRQKLSTARATNWAQRYD